jgi:hypothetical protein
MTVCLCNRKDIQTDPRFKFYDLAYLYVPVLHVQVPNLPVP